MPRRARARDDITRERLDDRPTAQRLMDAAADLFHRKGYAGTSVQDVADAVGLLKGSLYYYIDSKDDLLARLIEETQAENLAMVAEVARMTELPPLERLRLYVERQVMFNAKNLARITVYYRDMDQLPDERRKKILLGRRQLQAFVMQFVEDAQAEGAARDDMDARMITYGVFAVTNWLYTWYRPQGDLKASELATAFAEFVGAAVRGAAAA
jgi:TetR/AcrR family transcriptional regulator, cholesterol catabolism regulator